MRYILLFTFTSLLSFVVQADVSRGLGSLDETISESTRTVQTSLDTLSGKEDETVPVTDQADGDQEKAKELNLLKGRQSVAAAEKKATKGNHGTAADHYQDAEQNIVCFSRQMTRAQVRLLKSASLVSSRIGCRSGV